MYGLGFDTGLTPYQRGYVDGAFDMGHWLGEETSHDCMANELMEYDRGYWDGWENTEPLDVEYINRVRHSEWLDFLAGDYQEDEVPDNTADVARMFNEYEDIIKELRRQIKELEYALHGQPG